MKASQLGALRGVQAILVTPFTPELEVDHNGLAANVDVLLRRGVHGFIVSGTYGEFPSLTIEERISLFRTVCQAAGDRVPVIACIAHSSTREVLRLGEAAIEAGASAIMTTPPFVSEPSDADIIAHFAEVARHFPVGLVIYNNPRLGITLSPALLGRIVDEVSTVVGVKQGATDVRELESTMEALGSRIAVLCGSDTMITTGLGLGMPGCTSTNAGAFPELMLQIWGAFQKDRWAEARQLHASWRPFRSFAARAGQPATVKAAIDARGWRGGPVRPPLRILTADERDQLRPIVSALTSQPLGGT
jgi:4-hydroxy-tetrahydrodipicolinate synthase